MNEFGIQTLTPTLQLVEIVVDLLLVAMVVVVMWELIVLLACLIAARPDRSKQLTERRGGHA